MIPDNDLDYNVVREAEERLASTNATDPSAKRVHRQLAALYADRAWAARDAMFDADGRPGALERTRPA